MASAAASASPVNRSAIARELRIPVVDQLAQCVLVTVLSPQYQQFFVGVAVGSHSRIILATISVVPRRHRFNRESKIFSQRQKTLFSR